MENAGATTMNMRLLHPAEAKPKKKKDAETEAEPPRMDQGLSSDVFDHLDPTQLRQLSSAAIP